MEVDPGAAGASVAELLRPLLPKPQAVLQDDVRVVAKKIKRVAIQHDLQTLVELGVCMRVADRGLPIIRGDPHAGPVSLQAPRERSLAGPRQAAEQRQR